MTALGSRSTAPPSPATAPWPTRPHLAQLISDGRTESPWLPQDETVQIMKTVDEVRRQIG